MSDTYQYIDSLDVQEEGDDFVLKTANAREFIDSLPSPTGVTRNMNLVPDVAVDFVLSTSLKLPEQISEKVAQSKNKENFTDDTLLGLAMSGRGLPVKIFLHDLSLKKYDPSGDLFQEIAWHEFVHATEGIKYNGNQGYERETPWSYILQQEMLDMDQQNNHKPVLFNSGKSGKDFHLMNYLRAGTSLQDNVSEMFGYSAAIFMDEVKETGKTLTSVFDILDILDIYNAAAQDEDWSRKQMNAYVVSHTFESFSDDAKYHFIKNDEKFMKNIATLYGCEMS